VETSLNGTAPLSGTEHQTQPVRLIEADGTASTGPAADQYRDAIDRLTDAQLRQFHRDMVVTRRFDIEAANLQKQGQMGLWVPSLGQEAAQVGSAHAARPQDHLFPAYREHAVGMVRGLDLLAIVEMLRGNTHGGWNPAETGNFHLYTLVIGSHTLHATGYAMGIAFDGNYATGDPESDEAVIVYFGDGSTSQGDVSEALVFAASYQTPQVFFLQNNHWAISIPVERQSRTPLYLRSTGFGIPSVQIDGNDVLASYATTAQALDDARSGKGPRFIEALTYRMGAHTSSDDPSKYRDAEELTFWSERDPIVRYETFLRAKGADQAFFDDVAQEAEDVAADMRVRTNALGSPPATKLFTNVYTDAHPGVDAQAAWFAAYEASYDSADEGHA
jgi:pyruvate dehydrogenase E1 component alpha subunit